MKRIFIFITLVSLLSAKEVVYEDINTLIMNSKYEEATDLLKFTIYKYGYITKEAERLSNKLDKLRRLTEDIEKDKLQVVTHINGIEYDPASGERIYINKTFTKIKKWADKNRGEAAIVVAGLAVYSIGSLCKKYECLKAPEGYSGISTSSSDSVPDKENSSQDKIRFNISGFSWNFGVSCYYQRYYLKHDENNRHNREYNGFKRSAMIDGGAFDGFGSPNGSAGQTIEDRNGAFSGNWEFEFACQNSSTGNDEKVFNKSFYVESNVKNVELEIQYSSGSVKVVQK